MSYSIDVNILLHSSDTSSGLHARAHEFVKTCAASSEPLFLAYLTLLSYVRMATHPRIFTNPLTPSEALRNVRNLSDLPQVRLISEREGFLDVYDETTRDLAVRGNLVPDAHLATLLRQHGVSTLYTNNTDAFETVGFLDVRNPLKSSEI